MIVTTLLYCALLLGPAGDVRGRVEVDPDQERFILYDVQGHRVGWGVATSLGAVLKRLDWREQRGRASC